MEFSTKNQEKNSSLISASKIFYHNYNFIKEIKAVYKT